MTVTMMPRERWTDDRLDDLNEKVDRGFEQVDKRFEQVDKRFERLEDEIREFRVETNQRFDSLQRSLLHLTISLSGCMITGFAALIAAQAWA